MTVGTFWLVITAEAGLSWSQGKASHVVRRTLTSCGWLVTFRIARSTVPCTVCIPVRPRWI